MSALTLPLDDRQSNKYIHALEEQIGGKLRASRDKSVFFTTRNDSGSSDSIFYFILEDYKIIDSTVFATPQISSPLNKTLTLKRFTAWTDNLNGFLVDGGDGWIVTQDGVHIIPSGNTVTVAQNGSLTVPDENTFTQLLGGQDFLLWVNATGGEGEILPYTGKAWYGAITAPAQTGPSAYPFRIFLLKADGTYHTKQTANKLCDNFFLFTHLANLNGGQNSEVYFTGKEFDYIPDDIPGAYVAPDITYLPD